MLCRNRYLPLIQAYLHNYQWHEKCSTFNQINFSRWLVWSYSPRDMERCHYTTSTNYDIVGKPVRDVTGDLQHLLCWWGAEIRVHYLTDYEFCSQAFRWFLKFQGNFVLAYSKILLIAKEQIGYSRIQKPCLISEVERMMKTTTIMRYNLNFYCRN